MKKTISLFLLALGVVGCQPKHDVLSGILEVNMRESIQKSEKISMKDDVESIEYIPLETNDSCLISNLLNLQISNKFMFMYNGKTGQIFQFDRKGKFIRHIGNEGNGPGEYGMVTELSVNDEKQELTVFQYGALPLVYSFDGTYLRCDSTLHQAGGMYVFPTGEMALKGLNMNPIQNAPWAGALIDKTGEQKSVKALFPSSVNKDFLYMKEICFSPSGSGVLLFTLCNDTVFRMTSSDIRPAFFLNRGNASNYYDDIANITKLSDPTVENDATIGIYDMFETPNYFYVRFYKGEQIYIQRLDKQTRELVSYLVPEEYMQSSEAVPGNNVLGLDNDMDGGVPFWPEYAATNGNRAQVVSAYAIATLKEKGYLKEMPSALNISEDDNPVVVIYTFKKN